MKTQEIPTSEVQLSRAVQVDAKKRTQINDNLILTIILILGILGAFYILDASASPSTVNSQGYTIEFSSASR